MKKNITLGITGASGIPITFALLKELLAINESIRVNLIITQAGMITIKQETGIAMNSNPNQAKETLVNELKLTNSENLFLYGNNDWYAPMASGSSVSDAMVICPCSMATLGKITAGIGDDLLIRAADVILKERKNLILVPRETPLSAIHLANMQKLAELGVSIILPVPAFYSHPKTIEDIINSIVSRILDQLGISNTLSKRW
ncbi:MAG: UbiX family flavin prenyltransferase [Proteobacteria bacterium]|jgi:4-hydroxy-3-polyprenylbenzoate decarboxylase|nr:UbiX family flavin prenyltransferase [Pseudomonadota bacterium]